MFEPQTPVVFLNYRRDDAQDPVNALRSDLEFRLGRNSVFLDTETIQPGDHWAQDIGRRLDEAAILLVVIGPKWLELLEQKSQQPASAGVDWVRWEIERALASGKPIIPVLVAGATRMPARELLPQSLHGILDHQSYVLRSDAWKRDFDALLKVLRRQTWGHRTRRQLTRPRVGILAIVLVCAVCGLFWLLRPPPPTVAGPWQFIHGGIRFRISPAAESAVAEEKLNARSAPQSLPPQEDFRVYERQRASEPETTTIELAPEWQEHARLGRFGVPDQQGVRYVEQLSVRIELSPRGEVADWIALYFFDRKAYDEADRNGLKSLLKD